MSAPKISVYTTCKNNSRYLKATLDSILEQSFTDFEIVLSDGASTDGTLDLLQEYRREKRLKWISEPDRNPVEGYYKALARCSGHYIMCMPVSDQYLRRTWFAECVERLDSDPDLSLVHGHVQLIDESGAPLGLKFAEWEQNPPPDKEDFFAHWLALFTFVSEISYCVRADVYRKCYPVYRGQVIDYSHYHERLSDAEFELCGPHLRTLFQFNRQGYLAAFLPVVSSAARIHADSLSESFQNYLRLEAEKYRSDILAYREALLARRQVHCFRNGRSEIIATVEGAALSRLQEKIARYRELGHVKFGHFDGQNVHCREQAAFFLSKFNQWCRTFKPTDRVLIYGGGQHTEQLFQALGERRKELHIVGVVDRCPSRRFIEEVPVFSLDEVDWHAVERIIVSSRAFEQEIYAWLAQRVPREKVELIYSSKESDA
ncbi:MAG: glycosyltransferase [Desulfuromonadaceae bacterium]|nr:glycosyltransferase [Desulfuromonadaceae bacterium]